MTPAGCQGGHRKGPSPGWWRRMIPATFTAPTNRAAELLLGLVHLWNMWGEGGKSAVNHWHVASYTAWERLV